MTTNLANRQGGGLGRGDIRGPRRGFTPLLTSARAARQWANRRRESRMLKRIYPAVSPSLGLDPCWRVHHIVSTVGHVTVALVGGSAPAAVLKCARSDRGTTALETSGAVVDTLLKEPSLGGWTDLLPRRLATSWTPRGHLVVLEQLLPGEDGRKAIASGASDRLLDSVLESLSILHARTSAPTTVDQTLLYRWVDEPIATLTRWYDAAGESRILPLEQLRLILYLALEGREAQVAWTHGDLAPGNVLLDPETFEVSGLLDWERATAGLPEVDVIHLQLTTKMLTERRELGDVVCDLLDGPEERTCEEVGDASLVLLTWLHHVSGIVAKSDQYAARGLWGSRNVDRVLSRIGNPDERKPRHRRVWVDRVARSCRTRVHMWPALSVIVFLAAKALLRGHHESPPQRPWQTFLTMFRSILTLVTQVGSATDARNLAE